jgi:NTP pyrophosphatase (non-canonical NTP hydrolase)
MTNLIDKIKMWVLDRNLNTQDPRVQMCKTVEELGELANAINKGNKTDAMDGIGDVVVTLICVSMQLGVDFNECLKMAYDEIKDRKGKMVNGMFVKEVDL